MFRCLSGSSLGKLTTRKGAFLAIALSFVTFLLLFTNINLASAQESSDVKTRKSVPAIEQILRIGLAPSLSADSDQETSTDGSRVAMFRLYNKWTGEHFYTSSKSERDNIAKVGWVYEQIEWYAPTSEDFKPVYRLYNKYVSGGDHHYTTSSDEKDECVKAGWTYEGEGWRTVEAGATDYVKVLRQYNPYATTGTHNYTTDKNEQKYLVSLGWRAEADGGWGGYSKLEPSTPTPATTFTVTFNSNGGTAVAKQTVQSGKTAIKPANPTKEGYTFVAWCTDSACTKSFDFSTKITKNITLYAKWDQKSYKVTFNSNGGSSVAQQTVLHGKTATRPADPTKSGLAFGGWYTDKNLTKEFDFATKITSNITLYARWGESIAEAEIVLGESLSYVGKEQTQEVVAVKLSDRQLDVGVDYKVNGNKVTNAGTYTLTVTGIGKYAGTKTATFSVGQRELYISWPNTTLVYNGKKQGPIGEAGSGLIDSDKGKVIVGITEETKQVNASDTEYVGVPALSGEKAPNYYIHEGAKTVNFKINKADPTLKGLTTIYAEANQTLSDIALPYFDNGVLTWNDPATSIGEFEGTRKFPATFTPNDQNNYNTISVEVSVKLGAVKTNSSGIATVDNPKDGTSYYVLVMAYKNKYDKDNVAQAVVYLDDSGSLNAKLPSDGAMDARDPKVQVQKESDGTYVSNLSVVINKSFGEKIGNGKTGTDGSFFSHNGVETTTVTYGSCKCTSPSIVTNSCPVCEVEFSSEVIQGSGHPKDKIVAYGVNSVAKECQACGHVLFGTWDQDGNMNNGKESIEWMKLGDQKTDGSQLLLSLYGLEKKPFDGTSSLWQMCSLRRWLNNDSTGFYNTAFTSGEKSAIQATKSEELSCVDNVFLLTKNQAEDGTFFANADSRKCYLSNNTSSGSSHWWLMTPGGKDASSSSPRSADFVGSNGIVNSESRFIPESSDSFLVRPAITFKAKTPNVVKVTFKAEGVSATDLPKTQELYQGDVLQSVPEVSREGFTFVGWYKTGDESQVLIDETTTFSEDTELTALWATSTTYALTGDDGTAQLTNPATNEAVTVTVKSGSLILSKNFFSTPVSSAEVTFSETGNLNVRTPNCYRCDIKVSVAKQSDGSAITDQPCNVYNVDDTRGSYFLMSGKTSSVGDKKEITLKGDFWAHWGTNTIIEEDGTCECTMTTYETEQCEVCHQGVSTKVLSAPTGHPQDKLVDYGTDSTAKECKKCGHVLFGAWEQDGDEANGKETIEWIKHGSQNSDGTQLLLSLYALENKQFDPSTIFWKNSQIRSWLNTDDGGFYSSAFNSTEKTKISTTNLSDVSSDDNVFLLSETEAAIPTYFDDAYARACYFSPRVFDETICYDYSRVCSWYLRTTHSMYSGTGVGYIFTNSDTISGCNPDCVEGIRPAICFKVS